MPWVRKAILSLVCCLCPTLAQAQSDPGFVQNQILGADELNQAFQSKQDFPLKIGATGLIATGQRMVVSGVVAGTAGAGCTAPGTSSIVTVTGTGGAGSAKFVGLLTVDGSGNIPVGTPVVITGTGIYSTDPTLTGATMAMTLGYCTTMPTINITSAPVFTTSNGNEINVMTFGCAGDGVADDTNCLNTAFAYARTLLNVPPPTPELTTRPLMMKLPMGIYHVTGSLNWTSLAQFPNYRSLVIDASGAMIDCVAPGDVCIDMLNNAGLTLRGLQLHAGCLPAQTKVGLQLGRISHNNADINTFQSVFITGCSLLGLVYNMASESSNFNNVILHQFTSRPNLILDGIHYAEFAGGQLSSHFVDISLEWNSNQVFFNDFSCYECAVTNNTGSSSTAIWMANMYRPTFRHGYAVTTAGSAQGTPVTLFTGVGTFLNAWLDLHMEGGVPPNWLAHNFFLTSHYTPFTQVDTSSVTINNAGTGCTSTGIAVLTGTTGTPNAGQNRFRVLAQATAGGGISIPSGVIDGIQQNAVRLPVSDHGNYSVAPGATDAVISTHGCTGVVLNLTSSIGTVNVNPILMGFRFNDQTVFSTTSVFQTDASAPDPITTVTIQNAELEIPTDAAAAPNIFDSPAKYTVSGSVYIGSGTGWNTPATFSGKLCLANDCEAWPLNTTVALLPTCNAAASGQRRLVTDQNAVPVYNAAPAGGGAVKQVVFCDGTSWKLR